VQSVAQVDDVVIVERFENAVKDAFNRLEMEAQKVVQCLIMTEQKYMENDKKKEKCIRKNNRDIEEVNQFKTSGQTLPIMTKFHLQ
jgi:hypothetical protein